ncbi:MAG: hypothetical protein KAT57_10765 [Candidatus Lokiarchaeota archaeon]|nr:hypothetical protein [Candidatus Lokiarchaeota archaeon]
MLNFKYYEFYLDFNNLKKGVSMFQPFDILDIFSDPTVIQYVIGGIILLIVVIICYSIHRKLIAD